MMLFGTGADTSIFRQVPFVVRVGRIGLRSAKFALPAAVVVAWAAYPALTPNFKQTWGIP